MLRKLICLILVCFLCFPVLAEEEASSHLYHFTSASEAPAEIAAGIADLFGADVTYVDGYATMRFGRWAHGQIVLQDQGSYILCGLTCTENGWIIEHSRTALRPDEAPGLLPEAAKHNYDDYSVSQYDGCDSFEIIYGGLTYRWTAGSNGWQLSSIDNVDASLRLSISSQTIKSRVLSDTVYTAQENTVFNVLSPMLCDFDISAFPVTREAAKALSDASEYNDQTQALTVYDPLTRQNYLNQMADTTGVALVGVYPALDSGSQCSAYMFEAVSVEIIDHTPAKDWYQIRVHDFIGWVRRENLLIGTERARLLWREGGDVGCVYSPSKRTDQPIYATANHTAPSAFLPAFSPVTIQLIDKAGRYLIREGWRLLEGELGGYAWMDADTVCMTDNYHDAYIYSSDASRRLNLRTGPGSQYDSIGKYYSGVRVVLMHQTEAVKGWRRVIIEGVSGWVKTEYLAMYSDYHGKEWLPPLGKVQGVNSKGLNLRTAPNKNADIIAAYPVGTSVEILGIYDSIWAHVRLQNGNSGYMMLQFLGGEPEKAAANSFKLLHDITTVDGSGDALCEMKKGTRIRVIERPVDGTREKLWINTDDGYGYIPSDCANFW